MSAIKLLKDDKAAAIKDIQSYFLTERDEEIGSLSAEFLLDFMINTIGPLIYNQAIEDARALILRQLDDLYELQKGR